LATGAAKERAEVKPLDSERCDISKPNVSNIENQLAIQPTLNDAVMLTHAVDDCVHHHAMTQVIPTP